MFPFTSRRTDPPTPSSERTATPVPVVADARLTPDRIFGPSMITIPTKWDRFRVTVAGFRDGRHGLLPDPETGHTQYTTGIADGYGSNADSENLDLIRILSGIDELADRLDKEAQQLRESTDELADHSLTLGDADPRVDPLLDMRRRERYLARRQGEHQGRMRQNRARIEAIERDLAGLAQLRTHQISASEQRTHRARLTRQQLVDMYWRWFVRTHPEESAVRAGYPIPPVDCPTVTAFR